LTVVSGYTGQIPLIEFQVNVTTGSIDVAERRS
jgi:hypothetical protein